MLTEADKQKSIICILEKKVFKLNKKIYLNLILPLVGVNFFDLQVILFAGVFSF